MCACLLLYGGWQIRNMTCFRFQVIWQSHRSVKTDIYHQRHWLLSTRWQLLKCDSLQILCSMSTLPLSLRVSITVLSGWYYQLMRQEANPRPQFLIASLDLCSSVHNVISTVQQNNVLNSYTGTIKLTVEKLNLRQVQQFEEAKSDSAVQ